MQQRHSGGPPRRRTRTSADALARGLGWFSIALGTAELAAPHALARALGRPQDAALLQLYGAREIATGIGILASPRDPSPWLWGRVAGDLLDLATLGRGLGRDNSHRACVGAAMGAVAGIALLDVACARKLSESAKGNYIAPDYSDRSGFPRPAAEMRGVAAPAARRNEGPGAGWTPAPLGTVGSAGG